MKKLILLPLLALAMTGVAVAQAPAAAPQAAPQKTPLKFAVAKGDVMHYEAEMATIVAMEMGESEMTFVTNLSFKVLAVKETGEVELEGKVDRVRADIASMMGDMSADSDSDDNDEMPGMNLTENAGKKFKVYLDKYGKFVKGEDMPGSARAMMMGAGGMPVETIVRGVFPGLPEKGVALGDKIKRTEEGAAMGLDLDFDLTVSSIDKDKVKVKGSAKQRKKEKKKDAEGGEKSPQGTMEMMRSLKLEKMTLSEEFARKNGLMEKSSNKFRAVISLDMQEMQMELEIDTQQSIKRIVKKKAAKPAEKKAADSKNAKN